MFGAGRTDAGVHALAQVAHVDLPRDAAPDEIRGAVNHHLRPHAISVLPAEPVAADFDARLSATGRLYLYRILNRRAPPALERGRVWHVAPPLDVEAMREGAAPPDRASRFLDLPRLAVPGEIAGQDARRARGDAAPATKSISRRAARSFLHHQVRNMVGTLKLVGLGRWQPDDVARALAARDRRAGGPTAPADGLALVAVRYDDVMANDGTP